MHPKFRQALTGVPAQDAGPLTWAQAEDLARRLPPRTNLVIPKSSLAETCPHASSRRGRKYGARGQFRCHRAQANLHIKEFDGHWVMHIDDWNPHHHVVRHLMVDRGYDQFLHLLDVRTWLPAVAPAATAADE